MRRCNFGVVPFVDLGAAMKLSSFEDGSSPVFVVKSPDSTQTAL